VPIPVAARFIFGPLVAVNTSSNPAEGMVVVFIYCVVLCRYRPLRRADHSSRGVLAWV
jgi:hypothetical protein